MCFVTGLAGYLSPAAAQQPEKRIALVVGNGAYAKSPLATAANDAGLIAQTLQAAGFDVIGARDLDSDTLRKSFRDFIQKAESSGPDTVAMVYLAGYGLQLAGDNYFVPVDSAINRDTDVPTEALRTGDYIRQLASLPLKAGIVVLDAARQQPFVDGQIASGLALVEADPHMLIAFNAAPGTVAPAEQGPYGVYAQSLAEMIRTGGLPLPEVFNRLRLRVNEASKGAQMPWDSQKVDAGFTFFEREPDAPAQPAADQAAAVRNKPIRELGVQDAYAMAVERDTLQGYEEFLGAYASDPLAKRVRAIAAARREAITWRRTYRTDTPNAYWSYLQRYPRGPHAADARRRLTILTAPLEPPPTFDVIDYDVPPPPPDELMYIDRPVLAFGDPEFDFVAPPPAPVYYLPPPPEDFVVLEPPPAPIGLFILPQPIFVPIPVYVRPPRYVAPPPNNLIYANIHNRAVINNVINRPPAAPIAGPGGRPIGRPGSPDRVGAPGQGGAAPVLPPAVAQRATLI
ncbi:caspase family protein, partial [Bradyrhizobium lablabi]|uniref:caspase family protein n=1 Tax=Bradyrhizobium lablabi TaxID=722472 RepID=UPI001FD9F904